jgi:uncharacterized membrane protein YccC
MIQPKHSFSKRLFNGLQEQFQLKPGKPSITASLQVLLSVLVPLGVGVLMGHPTASAIAIMGAWFVGLVNVEGVYRQQAAAKITAAISLTAMLFLANLVHGAVWLSALTTFLVMFLTGFVGVLGQAAASISLITSIMFIVALAKFAAVPNWTTVLQQCLFCFSGGVWSIMVSLVIWKMRPYKPVLQSVSNCYEVLSQLVDAAKDRVAYPDDRRARLTSFLKAQDNYNQALIAARDRWSAAWTAQRSANPSANQLLILIEDTPLIANAVVALVEQVVISSDHSLFAPLQREIQQAIEQLASALRRLSGAIARGKTSIPLGDLDRTIEALTHRQQTLQTQRQRQGTLKLLLNDHTALTSLSKISATLLRLANQVHADAEMVKTLQEGNAGRIFPIDRHNANYLNASASKRSTLSSMIELLRSHLTVHSTFFRHALRLAIVATISEVVASLLQIPTGYWITLTAIVALKPNYGGTSQTAFQRVLGTVLGGGVGIAIMTLTHNAWVITGCLLLLIMMAVAVRSLSFSLFSMLLTPAIILLLNVTSQGGWQIGILRITDSLVGGLLALLGSYVLFPRWERQQLPEQLETAIQSNLAYFQQVITTYLHPNGALGDEIATLRRLAALENTNTAAAAQRLFSEPQHIQGDVEPLTTLIFYIRRFFNSVTALAEHRQELSETFQCLDFIQFSDAISRALENAAAALKHCQSPQPLPNLDHHLEAIHEHIRRLYDDRDLDASAKHISTHFSQAILERTPISAGLDQIAYEIKSIHGAIMRLK